MLYSGWDGKGDFFYLMEISYGGIPGRPIGDGMDGHSWWPLFQNIPTEYLEAYYPGRVYGHPEPGEVWIHDDRWLTCPWGILGGMPGSRSEKVLVRSDGSQERLPSKC